MFTQFTTLGADSTNDAKLTSLARLVADDSPRVRLEAVRALAKIPSAKAAELALSALDKPMDPFLDYALWLTINDLAQPWAEAVQSGAWKIEGREKHLEFALQAIPSQIAAPLLARLLQQKPIPRDGRGPWIELIGKAGSERELRQLFDSVLARNFDEPALARALAALNQAARIRKAQPTGDLNSVAALANDGSADVREGVARLAGSWKISAAADTLLALASDSSSSVRAAAFESLREVGGPRVIEALKTKAAKGNSADVRRGAVQTLAALNWNQAMPAVMELLSDVTDENEAVGLWRSLLANRGAARPISQALPKSGGIPPAVARAGMRVAREGGRSEPELVLALARSGGLEEASRALTQAEMEQMAARISQQGDPVRGESVYRRAELACVACHAIGGVGGKVGPDLTSIGASAPVDYLIESILFPNRKIKEGYHAIALETKDGLDISGVAVREDGEVVVVRDAANREVSVPKKNIERRSQSGSLMPTGLVDSLSPEQQIDLYRFLAELGKPGAFDATKGGVARLWRVRPLLHTDEQASESALAAGPLSGSQWRLVNSLVDGRITKGALEESVRVTGNAWATGLFAAAQLQVPRAGPVRFQISGAPLLAAWIDGKTVPAGSKVATELSPGVHTIVVKLDAQKLPDFLKLETSDGTFLTE